jgi:hypothetical protein
MTFGKRFSIHNKPAAPFVQPTCKRCFSIGRVRERGQLVICRVCAGTGKAGAAAERAALRITTREPR